MDIFLFNNRERPHIFFSRDLIPELKLFLTWHDLLTPFRHEVSKAYFPEQITILIQNKTVRKMVF